MNVRLVVCLGMLIAFLESVRYGLYSFLDAFGFWPFMAFGSILIACIIAAAFGWDYYEARQRRFSQAAPPPQPRRYPPAVPPRRFPDAHL